MDEHPLLAVSGQVPRSLRPHVERPHEPVGIAPFRLALNDEGLGADGELIAGTRACDLARPHLKRSRSRHGCGCRRTRRSCPDARRLPHRHRVAARRGIERVDAEGGERRIHRPQQHCHQVRTLDQHARPRAQIGNGVRLRAASPSGRTAGPPPAWRSAAGQSCSPSTKSAREHCTAGATRAPRPESTLAGVREVDGADPAAVLLEHDAAILERAACLALPEKAPSRYRS